ncbi:MAG TPA: O-antigen ligase family protein, partial [Anaerolineae bacterium]
TQGNPIFLSGYLITVLPFTLAALFKPWARKKTARTILIVAVSLQLAALVLAQSRGPLLGAVAGGILFTGLLLWQRHRRLLIAGTLIGLIGLSLPEGIAPSLSSLPVLNRLNFAQDAQTGTGRVRLILWQAVGRVVTAWPPVVPDGDTWLFLRPVLGYGLDTAAIVYMQIYPPELGHIEDPSSMWDRAHNEGLDVLTMQGGLGLLAYVVLGLVCARRGLQQWRASESLAQRAWIAAPLAALAAHVVEVQFAFTLTTTGMLVWLCVALLLIRPQTTDHRPQIADRALDERQRITILASVVGAIILSIVALRVDVASIWANALAGEARALDQSQAWQKSIDRYDRA